MTKQRLINFVALALVVGSSFRAGMIFEAYKWDSVNRGLVIELFRLRTGECGEWRGSGESRQ